MPAVAQFEISLDSQPWRRCRQCFRFHGFERQCIRLKKRSTGLKLMRPPFLPHLTSRMVPGVPRFFFDLVIDGKTLLDPTGGLFHSPAGARTAADQLAIHFMYCRVEICSSGNCVRVRDESGVEIHRAPIDYT